MSKAENLKNILFKIGLHFLRLMVNIGNIVKNRRENMKYFNFTICNSNSFINGLIVYISEILSIR